MKLKFLPQILLILIVVVSIVLGTVFVSLAYAAPGDVTITFTIPAAKVADFSAGFLKKVPIPLIEDPGNSGQMIDEFTPKQWIKEWLRRQAMRAYRFGKLDLAKDAAIYDPNAMY